MSSPTPPGTPKPAGSRWASRMGAAVRRSSTLLSIARPTTPQTDRDSDTASLRKSSSREALSTSLAPKVSTAPPPVVAPEVTIPTPIAESPAREAESNPARGSRALAARQGGQLRRRCGPACRCTGGTTCSRPNEPHHLCPAPADRFFRWEPRGLHGYPRHHSTARRRQGSIRCHQHNPIPRAVSFGRATSRC